MCSDKRIHNKAAKASSYQVPSHRRTPEGYIRGTEVKFAAVMFSEQRKMEDLYPRFVLDEKYIVISVFKPTANGKAFTEVTLRDVNGDCYGYVASHDLELWDGPTEPKYVHPDFKPNTAFGDQTPEVRAWMSESKRAKLAERGIDLSGDEEEEGATPES